MHLFYVRDIREVQLVKCGSPFPEMTIRTKISHVVIVQR